MLFRSPSNPTHVSFKTHRQNERILLFPENSAGERLIQQDARPEPVPSRCRGSSNNRGRTGFQGSAVEVGTEIHQHHANEKEEMQELNVKFAGYIGKVQALENRNATLQAELAALQGRFKGGPTGVGEEYELKFKEMRELIESLTNEKGAADIERGYIEEEVENFLNRF